MAEYEKQIHNIKPLFDKNSQILILGSFPSVLSRQSSFFYGHPQNRFWKVLAEIFNSITPETIPEKKNFLLKSNIALWDVIQSCDIIGSSDSSVKNAVANDLNIILNNCNIKTIFVNGKTAQNLYNKLIYPQIKRPAILLPSTSPANAAYDLQRLVECWQIIKTK